MPKVLELVDETPELKTSRLPRHPEIAQRLTKPHLYDPPKFDFKNAAQQNLQLLRYYRQQQVDAINSGKTLVRKERIAQQLNSHRLPLLVAKPETHLRVARKLNPTNYDAQNEELNANAHAIYVHPMKLPPEQNLKVLNDLIGKNPSVQLQGLKQLLQNPSEVKLIMPSAFQVNSPNVPLSQHAVDINAAAATSDESKDIVFKPDQESINKIQAELDASARFHAQKAIAAAQRQALVHVEEQHKALAKAQEEAKRIAMEKVRAHNEAIHEAYAQKKEEAVSNQEAESRIHTLPSTQQVITVVEEPQQDVALIQAHNEALIRVQAEHQDYHHQEQEPSQHIVYGPTHYNQEELQKLAEESNKAYGGEHEEVSKSKCKTFVNEKLEMFRQQFCNHVKYSSKAKNDALNDFVLELNCAKIERAKNFFSTKLREMYRENRKAFFSLCYFNVSSANIQLTNEFVFSNNLTDFNENLLRQKREILNDELEYTDFGENDSYFDELDISNGTIFISNSSESDVSEPLPSASAQKLVLRPHNKHKSQMHAYKHKKKLPHYHHIEHSPAHVFIPEKELVNAISPFQKEITANKDKEPTNVIVINNSNDNHNHGANVKFHHLVPPAMHRPSKYRHKRPHVHHKVTIKKKPSVKTILRISKKVDTVLSKLGHNIVRLK